MKKKGNGRIERWLVLIGALALLSGCSAQRPVLYPNAHHQQVGDAAAERDIEECMNRAGVYVKGGGQAERAAGKAAKDVAVGGASGAAVGAVGGAIAGNPGEAAAVGAATGATAGLLHSVFSSSDTKDPVFVNFVERCLREKGYEPIGWR